MNRRKFLRLIGIAPIVPSVLVSASLADKGVVITMDLMELTFPDGTVSRYKGNGVDFDEVIYTQVDANNKRIQINIQAINPKEVAIHFAENKKIIIDVLKVRT